MLDSVDEQRYEEERSKRPGARGFALAVVLLFLVLAVLSFLNSPVFRVQAIEVQGADYLSVQEVLLISGLSKGANVFKVPTRTVQKRLMATPRIMEARIVRHLPNTIIIRIRERHTVAYLPYGGFFVEMDRDGSAIAVSEAVTDPNIPVIVGLNPTYVAVGEGVRPVGPVMVACRIGAVLRDSRISNLSEINVSKPDDIVVRTVEGIRVYLGGSENAENRARLLDSMLSSVREQRKLVRYIDLRVDAKPVIGM